LLGFPHMHCCQVPARFTATWAYFFTTLPSLWTWNRINKISICDFGPF
jgi:hypothetical protein